jgi:hypothetical protein
MGKYHCADDLLFDWFGLVCFAIKTKIVSSHTADSKPVKQEVNSTVIPSPLVFPDETHAHGCMPTSIAENSAQVLSC